MQPSPSFLAISDIHIGLNLYNQPELGADLRRLLSEACKLAVRLKVDYLVIAGDLYDTNKPTPDLIRSVRGEIEEARLHEVRVVGIAGDHDKPVHDESWTRISGIAPINSVPQFAGRDYSDDPKQVMDEIRDSPNRLTAEWIFLHGQVPSLWPFCDERKKLDLATLPLFDLYPNLKGVVLGDIHKPYEGWLPGPDGRKAYIGYCGSLGITASNDIGTKIGLLHFDGQTMKRVAFDLGRDFVKIDLTTNATNGLEVGYYIEKYQKHRGRRPVSLVDYSPSTKERLNEIRPLHQLGFVRTTQQRPRNADPAHQAINIRSDITNAGRITAVLNDMVPDIEVRTLLTEALHTEDPKLVLDAFRTKYIGQ